MKKLLFALPVIALFCQDFSNPGGFGDLKVHLEGLDPNKGLVRVVLYNNPREFLSENGFCRADSAAVTACSADIILHGLPYGTYAAAFYQDYNRNGVIDQNWARIPTEPYAFSNGVHAKWSVPDYNSLVFNFYQPQESIEATLHKWIDQ